MNDFFACRLRIALHKLNCGKEIIHQFGWINLLLQLTTFIIISLITSNGTKPSGARAI